MSTFRVPDGVCNELDALIHKFWWGTNKSGRFLALKCWDSICQPKEFGGLGFRKFRDINSALLSKLGWNLLTEENKLWISLVKAKYLKNSNFFDYHLKNGVSFSWKSIVTAREVLRKGVLFNLGDGKSIKPWKDPWIPWLEGGVPVLKQGQEINDVRKVSDLKLVDGNEWNLDLLNDLCEPDSVEAIKRIKWP